MDVQERALRRGLPRHPGSDPWPTAPPASTPTSAGADRSLDGVGPEQQLQVEKMPPASQQFGRPAKAPTLPVTGARVALRRGLPRTGGAERWPAEQNAAPVGDAPSPVPAQAGTVEGPTGAGGSKSTGAEAQGAETRGVGTLVQRGPASNRQLRRGLPRLAGEAPYPVYSLIPATAETFVAEVLTASDSRVPSSAAGKRPEIAVGPAGSAVARTAQSDDAPLSAASPSVGPWAAARFKWAASLLVVAGAAVILARWFLGTETGGAFLTRYPGETHLPEDASIGFPAWVRWQHFLNLFFMILIIRSGMQIRREQRPGAFWTPRWSKGGAGKVSLTTWFHQCLDALWLLNGAAFIVLLFLTDHWIRIVPSSWEVFPNALSALLQYVSLDWPTENGWVNYNSLQQMMYALTIFIAAPLAAVTGYRMSSLWPSKARRLSAVYPVELARKLHFPVMLYFVVFIIIHVALVFSTGALRNLNHMYAGSDSMNWVGFWLFAGSIALIAVVWAAAKPFILAPVAGLMGKVSSR